MVFHQVYLLIFRLWGGVSHLPGSTSSWIQGVAPHSSVDPLGSRGGVRPRPEPSGGRDPAPPAMDFGSETVMVPKRLLSHCGGTVATHVPLRGREA